MASNSETGLNTWLRENYLTFLAYMCIGGVNVQQMLVTRRRAPTPLQIGKKTRQIFQGLPNGEARYSVCPRVPARAARPGAWACSHLPVSKLGGAAPITTARAYATSANSTRTSMWTMLLRGADPAGYGR